MNKKKVVVIALTVCLAGGLLALVIFSGIRGADIEASDDSKFLPAEINAPADVEEETDVEEISEEDPVTETSDDADLPRVDTAANGLTNGDYQEALGRGNTILDKGDIADVPDTVRTACTARLVEGVAAYAALDIYGDPNEKTLAVAQTYFYGHSNSRSLVIYEYVGGQQGSLVENSIVMVRGESSNPNVYKVAFMLQDTAGKNLAYFDGYYDASVDMIKVSDFKGADVDE